MTLSGWTRLWIVAGALVVAACEQEVVIIERHPVAAAPYPDCTLDIRVDEQGRTFWKGEEIPENEFDRRLKDGRIKEACVEPEKPAPESR